MSTALRRLAHALAALTGTFTGCLIVTSLALAGFSSASSATHTVQTKRIFLGSRTAGAHDVQDVSNGGAGTNKDDATGYADAIIHTTGTWTNAFAAGRYLKFSYNSPLPAGVPVSSVTFGFRMIPAAGTDTASYYFEVHRISDDSLLATHYSSGSPQTTTGTAYTTQSTSLSEVTTSDIANDIYVKVFGKESASKAWKIDMATVTLTMFGQTVTLFPKAFTDASTGAGSNGTFLGLDVAGDGVTYTNGTNWGTSYNSAKYLQFGFGTQLPTGAVITGVTFDRTWHSGGTQNVCYYIDVYSSTTYLASYGNASQISCSNSTGTWNTDHTSMPAVTAVSDLNQLLVRVIEKASAGQKSIDDLDSITVTYYLD